MGFRRARVVLAGFRDRFLGRFRGGPGRGGVVIGGFARFRRAVLGAGRARSAGFAGGFATRAGAEVGRAVEPGEGDVALGLHVGPKRAEEARRAGLEHLDIGVALLDADRADVVAGQITDAADQGQQGARFGAVLAADADGEPDRGAEGGAGRVLSLGAGVGEILGGRGAGAVEVDEGGGELVGAVARNEGGDELGGILGGGRVPGGIRQQPGLVGGVDLFGGGGGAPLGLQLGATKQAVGLAAEFRRHDQRGDPLAPGAAGAAGAVQQGFGIGGQVGVDHQLEIGQVDAPGGDIGGHANPRAAVAQGLQRVAALGLGQLARERHDGEVAVGEAGGQAGHRGAGVAEDDGVLGFVEAQDVEDRVLGVAGVHVHRAVFDVGVLAGFGLDRDPLGVALVALRQPGDGGGHGGREHQGAAGRGGFVEDELELFAEAEVEHLVGLVQHHGAQPGEVDVAALDVVAEAPGGGDDDVTAPVERAPFAARVHAADAGGDDGAGLGIEPAELAADLHRQFAGRRDDQREGAGGGAEAGAVAQEVRRDGQPEAHGLAGTGLGGDQQVGVGQAGIGHGLLDRGQRLVALFGEGFGKCFNHGGMSLAVRDMSPYWLVRGMYTGYSTAPRAGPCFPARRASGQAGVAATASAQGDMTSVAPLFCGPVRPTAEGQAK